MSNVPIVKVQKKIHNIEKFPVCSINVEEFSPQFSLSLPAAAPTILSSPYSRFFIAVGCDLRHDIAGLTKHILWTESRKCQMASSENAKWAKTKLQEKHTHTREHERIFWLFHLSTSHFHRLKLTIELHTWNIFNCQHNHNVTLMILYNLFTIFTTHSFLCMRWTILMSLCSLLCVWVCVCVPTKTWQIPHIQHYRRPHYWCKRMLLSCRFSVVSLFSRASISTHLNRIIHGNWMSKTRWAPFCVGTKKWIKRAKPNESIKHHLFAFIFSLTLRTISAFYDEDSRRLQVLCWPYDEHRAAVYSKWWYIVE